MSRMIIHNMVYICALLDALHHFASGKLACADCILYELPFDGY